MKNITVSVDEETHRLARIRAAELDTSVSSIVRTLLRRFAVGRMDGAMGPEVDMAGELRRSRLREAIADIRAASGGFRAADNVPRSELYER